MKKIIFIISFLLAIQHGCVFASGTEEVNETMKAQEESLGISQFIKTAENYTKETFEDIELNNIYKSALSGKFNTSGILNIVLKIAGKEVTNTIKTLGYILIIIIVHGIIKSISDNTENRGNRGDNLLCPIHTNRNFSYG